MQIHLERPATAWIRHFSSATKNATTPMERRGTGMLPAARSAPPVWCASTKACPSMNGQKRRASGGCTSQSAAPRSTRPSHRTPGIPGRGDPRGATYGLTVSETEANAVVGNMVTMFRDRSSVWRRRLRRSSSGRGAPGSGGPGEQRGDRSGAGRTRPTTSRCASRSTTAPRLTRRSSSEYTELPRPHDARRARIACPATRTRARPTPPSCSARDRARAALPVCGSGRRVAALHLPVQLPDDRGAAT